MQFARSDSDHARTPEGKLRAEIESDAPGDTTPESLLGDDAATATATVAMPVASPLLNDRYRIERELSRGGLGVVYLARDERLHGRPVVIKVPLNVDLDHWIAHKFGEEIRALSLIDHPGVVGVLDSGRMPDGKPFFVMQFVEGQPLRKLLSGSGIPFEQAGEILRQIGQALVAAHEKGVWHRDLKPENIMVQRSDGDRLHVRLIDFGIASVTAQSAEGETRVVGSLPYMAPEQLEGRVSAASDIYAFGVIAYEMLTGSKPFTARDPIQRFAQQRTGAPKPTALRSELPAAAEETLLAALSFRSEDRPTSASAFAAKLAEDLRAPAAAYASAPLAERASIPSHRRALLGAAVAGVLAAAAVGSWWALSRNPAPAPAQDLTFSVLLQPMRDGQPAGPPHLARIGRTFRTSDAFSLLVRSSRPGYLYILSDDSRSLAAMFPAPYMYGGSSAIAARQQEQIPEHSWYRFDPAPSAQDVWLVWSAAPLPRLEAVRKWMNPRDRGVIGDDAQRDDLRKFLAGSAHAVERRGSGNTEQTVTSTRPSFAWKVRLQTATEPGS